jgi:hypothetical protein
MPNGHGMSLDDTTKILGVIGGVTGPVGLIIAYLTYRRDAARVRVRLHRGWIISNGPHDEYVRAMLAEYRSARNDPPMHLYIRDPDKTWGEIGVTNIGRRPIQIEKVAWVNRKGKFVMPGGYMGDPQWLPVTLEEGTGRDFLIEDSKFDQEGVLAVAAFDRTGRGHYGSFARSWSGWIVRVKAALHVTPYT